MNPVTIYSSKVEATIVSELSELALIQREFGLRRGRQRPLQIDCRLLRLMAASNQAADQIDHEIRRAAVPRMLDLRDILPSGKHSYSGSITVSMLARKRASNLSVSRIDLFLMLRLGFAKNSMPNV